MSTVASLFSLPRAVDSGVIAILEGNSAGLSSKGELSSSRCSNEGLKQMSLMATTYMYIRTYFMSVLDSTSDKSVNGTSFGLVEDLG